MALKKTPTVGIMATKTGSHFSFSEYGFFRALIMVGNLIGVKVFVFSPIDISWQTRTIQGWTWSKTQNRWISGRASFPDVVYDRLFPGRTQYNHMAFQVASRLREFQDIRFVNTLVRGKWQVYKALSVFDELKEYIPETKAFSSLQTLIDMINKYKVVFLKPDSGSQGKGIMRIQLVSSVRCHYKARTTGDRIISGTTTGLEELRRVVSGFTGGRKYLVQQGLSLRIFHNRPCDIRVVVQKDGKGQWGITGHAVRVGPAQGVTSNLHGGGTAIKLSRLLSSLYPNQTDKQLEVAQQIERFALEISQALDSGTRSFGEFGLDVGLDTHGRVWLLEVNSKPGRKVFLHTGDKEARRASIVKPIYYCKYLATLKE